MLYIRLDYFVLLIYISIRMKKSIAVFDFDGTLTRDDTLILFIRHVVGKCGFWLAIVKCFPWLLAFKLKLYPNWKAKQKLFATCFKGMEYNNFVECGTTFAAVHSNLLRVEAIEALEKHLNAGNKVYIVTASMEEWVRPLLAKYPSLLFITTTPECMDGRLTGCFASPNCYGVEKVRRFILNEPFRDEYELFVYGDSAGDKALLKMADNAYYRRFS